jgi:hypothetical protein
MQVRFRILSSLTHSWECGLRSAELHHVANDINTLCLNRLTAIWPQNISISITWRVLNVLSQDHDPNNRAFNAKILKRMIR